MAEIGAQLREARTRARIEIAQMEAQTKIRAKYLRALENEEWELLPGPTYVKSFLKTYGDMLGMDGRALVTEYKRSQEPFTAEGDIGQLSKHTGGRVNRNQGGGVRGWLVGIGVVLAVAVIGVGYALFNRDGADETPSAGGAGVDVSGAAQQQGSSAQVPASPVSVSLTATANDLTVCVRAGSRIVVPVRTLRAGQRTKTVRGRSVVVTVDSRSVRLVVDGKRAALPAGSGAITVGITEGGVRALGPATTACRA